MREEWGDRYLMERRKAKITDISDSLRVCVCFFFVGGDEGCTLE
jgi:hypothetical protein